MKSTFRFCEMVSRITIKNANAVNSEVLAVIAKYAKNA